MLYTANSRLSAVSMDHPPLMLRHYPIIRQLANKLIKVYNFVVAFSNELRLIGDAYSEPLARGPYENCFTLSAKTGRAYDQPRF
jgi:hypothetical protein